MDKKKTFHFIKIIRNHIISLKLKPISKSIMISLMIITKNKHVINLASKISEYVKLQYMDLLFYSKFIETGDLCFDIGSNIGNKTETFLRLGSNVISVEPQSSCINKLNKRFLGISNVEILNLALGESNCRKKIYICEECVAMSTFSKKFMDLNKYSNHHWSDYEIVKVITLDELIKLYGIPKLCKIDVEGYELEVIHGLSNKIEFISFEAHLDFIKEIEEIFELLKMRFGDFEVNFKLGECGKFYYNSWKRPDVLINIFKSIKNPDIYLDIMVKFDMGSER